MFRSQRPPLQRQSSAEKALARANQRLLRGSFSRDEESSDNEDDINQHLPSRKKNYLSSLRKKTAQTAEAEGRRRLSLGDGSDISITDSSDSPRRAARKPQSKFLKSKPATAPQSNAAVGRAAPLASASFQRSAALTKARSLAGRLSKARGKEESESPAESTPELLYAKSAKAKLNYLTDEESASIGRDGLKFMKKKEEKEEGNLTPKTRKQLRFAGLDDDDDDDDDDIREAVIGEKSPKTPSSQESTLNSGRLRRSFTVSDEDMSTAELGDGLISSSSGPDTPKKPALKSPDSPASPKKRVTIAEAEEVESDVSFLEENLILPRSSSSSSESESASGVEEKVMDAADLLSDDDSSPGQPWAAVQAVDDLSSASAVSEERSPSSSSSSAASNSTVIRSEARGVSQYESDFEASDMASEQSRATARSSSSSSSLPRRSSSDSEQTTVTESYSRRVHRRRRRSRAAGDADKSVQTVEAGLHFAWDAAAAGQAHVGPALGMAAVDGSPIAHCVVSPEALEGVTAYSPCVVALNNLLRRQLEMTQSFMATQRRLHDAMARTILPEHAYTTLEATRRYIDENRPKSMTMEEALREVEQEMNA